MSTKKLVSLTLALSALPAMAGCTGGYVYDASSKSALTGVTVHADAQCIGNGCQSSTFPSTTSSSSGLWDFDAYGNQNGAGDLQQISPLRGHETLNLLFGKPGYGPLYVYHRQNFQAYTEGSNTYEVDQVNSVYLCPNGAKDTDGDGLCDVAEASYGTSPNSADTDGDGLDDRSEVLGTYNGTVGDIVVDGVDLAYYGAKANHKDVFVYYNWYVAPIQAALTQVVTAFASAPVSNPDGTTGIALHLIDGGQIAAADQVADFVNVPADWTQVDVIKRKYFPGRYANVSHYAIFATQWGGNGSSGLSRGIPAHDFIVTLGGGGTQQQQAGTFMHEFGHNLGLQHGGNEGNNCKPNYLSIMSYEWQFSGLQTTAASGILDYSRFVIEPVNEGALIETKGMTVDSTAGSVVATTYQTRAAQSGCWSSVTGSGNGASEVVKGTIEASIDWNNDGTFETKSEALSLDGDSGLVSTSKTFSKSQNDWAALIYTGNASGGGTISGAAPATGTKTPNALRVTPQIVAAEKMQQELSR